MQNLMKEWKQPSAVILQQANFCNVFNLRLWLRIIRRSDQGVQFMNFPSQIFFVIPLYMAVTSYCYNEKVRRTMGTAVVSYLLKYFYSFSYEESNMKIAMMKIFNNCIAGRLNSNYFSLNKSSNLSTKNVLFIQ